MQYFHSDELLMMARACSDLRPCDFPAISRDVAAPPAGMYKTPSTPVS